MNALAKKLPDLSPLPGVKPLSETHRVDGRELRVVGMTRMVLNTGTGSHISKGYCGEGTS